jgi:preprotein translocase SecE subunit
VQTAQLYDYQGQAQKAGAPGVPQVLPLLPHPYHASRNAIGEGESNMATISKRISDSLRNTWFDKTRLGKYVVNVFVELDHVTWPTKDDVVNSGIVVIIFLLIFGAIIGVIDMGLVKLFDLLVEGLKNV